SGETIADGIAVGRPREGVKALRAVNETNGYALSVSDEEILEAVRTLTETAGVFVEPSAAATLAGLNKLLSSSLLSKSDRVVLLLTGHGLKAPEAAIGDLKAMTIEPDISDVEKVLEG
ncbi:MAG: pyridoxal-phosphate dependent enzyme, partial [Candidatus Marinimicrobia bacterium]|nr:pyridoxal-phosphate dependent enzyme [Candidatus Neomarinimicrobiota bacterium]